MSLTNFLGAKEGWRFLELTIDEGALSEQGRSWCRLNWVGCLKHTLLPQRGKKGWDDGRPTLFLPLLRCLILLLCGLLRLLNGHSILLIEGVGSVGLRRCRGGLFRLDRLWLLLLTMLDHDLILTFKISIGSTDGWSWPFPFGYLHRPSTQLLPAHLSAHLRVRDGDRVGRTAMWGSPHEKASFEWFVIISYWEGLWWVSFVFASLAILKETVTRACRSVFFLQKSIRHCFYSWSIGDSRA